MRSFARFLPVLVGGILLAMWLGAPITYLEIPAPDGTGERLAARHARYRSILAAFPGGSGEHPGVLVLTGPGGEPCGRMPVPQVSLITDARWEPGTVSLPGSDAGAIRRCVVREGLTP